MSKDKEIKRIKQLMFGKKKQEVEEVDEIDIDGEMTEEGEATSSGGASSGYPTVTKWESGVTRGKANPIANNKWESGITRGKANTLI
jgi:hypothetical protein